MEFGANQEESKRIARRFREDLWKSGNLSLADEIIDPDCLVHARIPAAIDFATGPEAMKHLLFFYQLTFSEIAMHVEDVIAEGDLVSVRWSGSGRHTGELFGVIPTQREIKTSGIDMLRIRDGKIVEGWVNWDAIGMLEQILGPTGTETEGQPGTGADFLSLIARLQANG